MRKKPEDVYFWQFAKRYLTEVVDQHRLSTYLTAKSVITQAVLEFGHLRMSALTRQHLQVYLTRRAKDLSPATVRQHWVNLGGLLRYAESENLIEEIRKPKLPKVRRKSQAWRTLAEMKTFIGATVGPMKILVMLLAETGCRIGEALALEARHLDPVNKQLKFEQTIFAGQIGPVKTAESERTVALSDELCYALDAFRVGTQNTFIFRGAAGRPWAAQEVRNKFFKLCQRLNLPYAGFHAFRRGNATMLAKDLKVPTDIIAQRLGHDLATAQLLGVTGLYIQKVAGADRPYVARIAQALYGTTPPDRLAKIAELEAQIAALRGGLMEET